MNVALTEKENQVMGFLMSRNNGQVYWEELAQFSKNPQNVNIKTVKKTVSEIKRKYTLIGEPLPFQVSFTSMVDKSGTYDISPNEVLNAAPTQPSPQKLVAFKRTSVGKTITVNIPQVPQPKAIHPCHVDFVLNKNSRRVHTKDGAFNLNDNEYNVFAYLHEHVGTLVALSELRDKVVYQHFGSKLPARWFSAILRIVGNIRHQIPGIRGRLMTIASPGQETKFLFQ